MTLLRLLNEVGRVTYQVRQFHDTTAEISTRSGETTSSALDVGDMSK